MGCAKQPTITPNQNEKEIKELKARIEKLEQQNSASTTAEGFVLFEAPTNWVELVMVSVGVLAVGGMLFFGIVGCAAWCSKKPLSFFIVR